MVRGSDGMFSGLVLLRGGALRSNLGRPRLHFENEGFAVVAELVLGIGEGDSCCARGIAVYVDWCRGGTIPCA